jgi:hypothetical protein
MVMTPDEAKALIARHPLIVEALQKDEDYLENVAMWDNTRKEVREQAVLRFTAEAVQEVIDGIWVLDHQ